MLEFKVKGGMYAFAENEERNIVMNFESEKC